jgi:medium-chain acyl-[acyl-carrier-protein] hydrolase
MSETCNLQLSVAYGDVDRENVITLQGVFKLLQEAAIAHASQYDTGTAAMATRGESWVLKRMAVAIERYPRYGEPLRVETWSSGIREFKGYREFRVFAGADELVVRGSSVWAYVSMRTRSIVRVPPEVASGFPSHNGGVFCPDLEELALTAPAPADADVLLTSLRYSDVDANDHVNNTAYLDLLQTALARLRRPVRPQRIRIKYGKGIPGDATGVEVRLAPRSDQTASAFSIGLGAAIFAQGDVS